MGATVSTGGWDAATALRLATRRTPLALAQTAVVMRRLALFHPEIAPSPLPLTTRGDTLLEERLDLHGGKGLFVKELERALVDGRADAAVHSLKDVPAVVDARFRIAAVLARDEARDALLGAPGLEALPPGARIGTSSRRRESQLRRRRPDVCIVPVRGGLGRRLERLESGDCDALVLAAAGLWRLGWGARVGALLPVDEFVPAIGQGALAVEVRSDDHRFDALWGALHDPTTARAVRAERAFGRALGADCTTPLAAHAREDAQGRLVLVAFAASPDGRRSVSGEVAGTDPDTLALALARRFQDDGAPALFTEDSPA